MNSRTVHFGSFAAPGGVKTPYRSDKIALYLIGKENNLKSKQKSFFGIGFIL